MGFLFKGYSFNIYKKKEYLVQDKIETIPKTMEKFFGCSGKMVKPSQDTVKALIGNIRKGKLITIEQLRNKLASDFSVQSACPASTMKILQLLSKEQKPICYWRVIKKKGELIAKFPNGLDRHASLLKNEGFEIDSTKKNPVVVDYEAKLSNIE